MRALLDECVPVPLKHSLTGLDVSTIRDEGWSGKKNGELLTLMGQFQFDVLITVDQNLPFQQNWVTTGIAIIVMKAKTNRMADLVPLVPSVLNAAVTIQPGDLITVN